MATLRDIAGEWDAGVVMQDDTEANASLLFAAKGRVAPSDRVAPTSTSNKRNDYETTKPRVSDSVTTNSQS